MSAERFSVKTVRQDQSLIEQMEQISLLSWPEFMLHASGGAKYWPRLYADFPDYQFGVFNQDLMLVAAGWSLPLRFQGSSDDLPDEGWDWAMTAGFEGLKERIRPNIHCALAIVVHPSLRGKKLSSIVVENMKRIGGSNGLQSLIAPVRPNLKAAYPLIEMQSYITWTNAERLPFDPWMRVHARLGAKVVRACNRSMQIYGTVEQWQQWSGMRLPESGRYVIPGALAPVEVDCENDRCTYIEPNVWMWHPMDDGVAG